MSYQILEAVSGVKRAWELVGSSAPLEKQEKLREYAQDTLEHQWPSLGYAVRALCDVYDPDELAISLAQTRLLDDDSRGELVAALERMYTRGRSAGLDELDALRTVLERALG
jgi:hypothetical protein